MVISLQNVQLNKMERSNTAHKGIYHSYLADQLSLLRNVQTKSDKNWNKNV